MRRAFRLCVVAGAVAAAQFVATAQPAREGSGSAAQAAKTVRVGVIPDPPFIERDDNGEYLNCDFRVENRTSEKIRLTRLEVSTFDGDKKLSSRRFLSEQGSFSSGLQTLPRRDIESDAAIDIFNPFHTFDTASAPTATIRFDFQFQGAQRYDASITIQPASYRPRTSLVVPLRGRFLVYDGHDYYSHHRRIDLSSPAVKRLGLTINPVRYAYDFSPVDDDRAWYRRDAGRPENWVGYDAPLYAPAAGRIVSVANDVPDNILENGRLVYPEFTGDIVKRLFGNHVMIDHATGEYSLLAHLKAKSVTVGLNDRVSQNQVVGRIGFSGDTGLHVHVHYQLADNPDPMKASSLPVYFSGHRVAGSRGGVVKEGLLHTGQFIER